MDTYPPIPKLFYCKKCGVYFYTNSKIEKPTHPRCKGHNTEQASEAEKKYVEKVNGN